MKRPAPKPLSTASTSDGTTAGNTKLANAPLGEYPNAGTHHNAYFALCDRAVARLHELKGTTVTVTFPSAAHADGDTHTITLRDTEVTASVFKGLWIALNKDPRFDRLLRELVLHAQAGPKRKAKERREPSAEEAAEVAALELLRRRGYTVQPGAAAAAAAGPSADDLAGMLGGVDLGDTDEELEE